jgi:hypothetical protein
MKRPILIALLCTVCAAAGAQQPPAPPKDRHGPPPEAMEACKGKRDGDTASAKSPRGDTISGTCRLVLIPEGQRGDKPPRQ